VTRWPVTVSQATVEPSGVTAPKRRSSALAIEVSALASMGRLPEAEEQLGWAVRLRPSSAEAHHQLGLVAARRGRLAEARGHQREALRLRPDFEEASRALAAPQVDGADARP